jgi:hypothetical protein
MFSGMARPLRLHLLTGRPTRYTTAAAAEICSRLAQGESLVRICADPHLPAESTVRDWLVQDRHPRFTEAYRRAREHQARAWFEQVVDLADESACATSRHEVASYQLRANSRKWACARALPHEFGDRVHIAGGGAFVGAQISIYLPAKRSQSPTIDRSAVEILASDTLSEALPRK